MRITVIGTGYLGATHAVGMAELGHEVLGVDTSAEKVDLLRAGRAPFYEPGLESLLRKHVESGRLSFTTSSRRAAEFGEVHFLCVGTPQRADGEAADLSQVEAAVQALAPGLREGAVVVGKSTVPVGTAERVKALLAELSPVRVDVAWNPEFLREGFAVRDTLTPDRIVLGVRDERTAQVLRRVYQPIIESGCPVVETDLRTAELVKAAANSFLATKISFINAVSEVCDLAGADVVTLARAIGYDERIGGKFLRAGVGFGGGCLPKDVRAFRTRAGELGATGAPALLSVVDSINAAARQRVVKAAEQLLGGGVAGRVVAVLGAAFKPDSDDVRDSPALFVARRLRELGAVVRVCDPEAVSNAERSHPELSYTTTPAEAMHGADLTVLLTEWTEYRELSPEVAASWVAGRRMLDARNALPADRWRAAGWVYRGIGVSDTKACA